MSIVSFSPFYFQVVQYYATAKFCSLPFSIDGRCGYNLSKFYALGSWLLSDSSHLLLV